MARFSNKMLNEPRVCPVMSAPVYNRATKKMELVQSHCPQNQMRMAWREYSVGDWDCMMIRGK